MCCSPSTRANTKCTSSRLPIRIAAINGRQGLSEALARLSTVTNDTVLFGLTVSTDTIDRQR